MSTQLILLGTAGGPTPKLTRSAPAQVIVVNGASYVIDCGNGVARQMVLAGVPLPHLRGAGGSRDPEPSAQRRLRGRVRRRDRGGAARGRQGAEARHPGDAREHAAGVGRRRHRHRPGRLLRDQPSDHPLRSHLRRGGRRPLLRREHPGRGRPDVDARAQQRDVAYLVAIADRGITGAATDDAVLAKGLSTLDGDLVSEPVAAAHDLPYTDPREILARTAGRQS